jgi:hypothetical protein
LRLDGNELQSCPPVPAPLCQAIHRSLSSARGIFIAFGKTTGEPAIRRGSVLEIPPIRLAAGNDAPVQFAHRRFIYGGCRRRQFAHPQHRVVFFGLQMIAQRLAANRDAVSISSAVSCKVSVLPSMALECTSDRRHRIFAGQAARPAKPGAMHRADAFWRRLRPITRPCAPRDTTAKTTPSPKRSRI